MAKRSDVEDLLDQIGRCIVSEKELRALLRAAERMRKTWAWSPATKGRAEAARAYDRAKARILNGE